MTPRTRRGIDQAAAVAPPLVSDKPFFAYLAFTVFQFLNVPKWVPGLGLLRPTVLLLALTCMFLYSNREHLKGRFDDIVSRRLLLLVGYIVVSLPFVTFPGSVLRGNMEVFVRVIAFFFLTALVIDSERRLRIFVWVFLGCQFVRVLDPLRRHITDGYWGSQTFLSPGEMMGRLSSAPWDTVNPNGYAFVIVTTFIFAHFLMLSSPRRIVQIAYLASVPAMLYALDLTASRSGLVALLIAFAGIFFYSRRRGMLIAAALAVAVVGIANMSQANLDRYLSLVRSDVRGAETVDARLKGAVTEFRLWLRRPIFGTGLGTSAEARYHFTGVHRIAHNMYLETMIELGIIGFAILMSVLVAIAKRAREARRRVDSLLKGGGGGADLTYYTQLGKALKVWFVTCVVFSLAHYGLSDYPWYLFAGLMVAYTRAVSRAAASGEPGAAGPVAPTRGRRVRAARSRQGFTAET